MTGPAPSFLSLLSLHEDLVEGFLRHQEALLEGDIERARALLGSFGRAIRDHIRHEEEVLLPVYEERCGPIEGAPPALFYGEHRKIEGFLDEFAKALAAGDASPRARIALLDREAVFKNLLHHHDLREKSALYPELDRATQPAERARMLRPPSGADTPVTRRPASSGPGARANRGGTL